MMTRNAGNDKLGYAHRLMSGINGSRNLGFKKPKRTIDQVSKIKFHTKLGVLTYEDVFKLTGLDQYKARKLLNCGKTMDQILEEYGL
jgi:hypothetical protein